MLLSSITRRRPALPGLLALALTLQLGAAARADDPVLAARLDAALQPLGPHAASAVRVLSLDRKQVLYERNADLSLNPASNMKLVTSAAAMAKLGPGYRFTTRVLATVRPDADGVLAGDLVLQGGGDPVLETKHLEALADAVKAAGIRRVTGSLIADDSRYDSERLGNGWNWDDESFYYSAQVGALSVNRNVLQVDVLPGRAGEPVMVRVHPLDGYLRVVSCPTTSQAGAPTRLSVTRDRGKNEVRISGTLAEDGKPLLAEDVTVEDPDLFTGELFRKLLADRGIQLSGVRRGCAAPDAIPVAHHESVPLSEILPLLNKPSDNFIAEMLCKELGKACKGAGDWNAGTTVIEEWLKEIGIDTGGVKVNDGSGLSRLDLVTARVVSDLLVWVAAQPWKDAFEVSLPVAGVDGTLRSRLKGTPAEKNVHAKTGSLAHVTALSGYVSTAGGERLVFSMLINNYPGPLSGASGAKRAEDAVAVALSEYRASP
ncbi:MAG TPA: D-alanyl-D-alanine carboxypeptidase/D-alanyl-D-alanine-endopeptidase [Armatimonadota bacterium]|nr:D-alanyl-D-alanine carboxypeptidase/D-alanyl-D-alanine-endopeptidase [Armatimonadota bacterium]